MTATALPPTAVRTVPRWLRGIFIANLVAQIGIVVTGGIVRLTGSGLGCPTWPECVEGSYTPTSRQEEAWHKYVEFGNRLLTFVLGLLAIAAIVGALAWWRRHRGRADLVLLAAIPIVGTVVQAVLGGITVLTGLNPWAVGGHFLVSMGIIAGTTVLVMRASPAWPFRSDPPVRREIRLLSRILVAVTALVVVLGVIVTGSGPHSGDAETEARFGLDPRTVSWLHADAVLLFLGLLIGAAIALKVTNGPERAQKIVWTLLAIAVIQGVIGYGQYFTGLPWALVAIHMLGACVVWMLAIMQLLALGPAKIRASATVS